MKPIEYLYFNIYNHFYQRSYSLQDFNARIQAMYLFSLTVGGWILIGEAVYLRIFRHSWFTTKAGSSIFAASVYMLTALVFNYIFIVNESDRKIYGKYEEQWGRNPRKRRDLILSMIVIVVPYLLLGSLAVFFPRHK